MMVNAPRDTPLSKITESGQSHFHMATDTARRPGRSARHDGVAPAGQRRPPDLLERDFTAGRRTGGGWLTSTALEFSAAADIRLPGRHVWWWKLPEHPCPWVRLAGQAVARAQSG